MDFETWLKYPLIVPWINGEYRGFLTVKDKDYKVRLKPSKTAKFKLEIDGNVDKFIEEIEKLQNTNFKNCHEFLDALVGILSNSTEPIKSSNLANVYRTILNEFAELQQFYINIHRSTISNDLQKIEIEHLDDKKRNHKLTIKANFYDKQLFSVSDCKLPEFDEETFEPTNSLSTLYKNFVMKVECPKLQMIFDVMDEIDANCWVLDPETPNRKDLHRRIMLENNVSIIVKFDTNDATNLPMIKFLGPQNQIKKYVDALDKNYLKWNPQEDIFLQLMTLLEIDSFMSKPTYSKNDDVLVNDGECCICFSLRLNDKMPEIICPNQACSQFFHIDCLYQWLCSLNSRKFYYEIYGKCPNCEKSIHCPLPSNT